MSQSLTTIINNGAPYVLQFAGQGSPWQAALRDLESDSSLNETLANIAARAEEHLSPVLPELAHICAGNLDLLTTTSNQAFASVPGIALAQYGALCDLDLATQPVAYIGHSQGSLAVAIANNRDPEHVAYVIATARLIGAAATAVARQTGTLGHGNVSPMMAVVDIDEKLMTDVVSRYEHVWIAIRNTATSFTLSGKPQELEAVAEELAEIAERDKERHAKKLVGGSPINPLTDFIDVHAPFHSALLEAAHQQVMEWARVCNWNTDVDVELLSRSVLTDRLDWDSITSEVLSHNPQWVIDLGPGTGLKRITTNILAGRGIGYINASTTDARDRLNTPGETFDHGQNWDAFAPHLIDVDGKTYLDTRFSRLTGRSPILLAGMTPTTVEPDIVAAAANAGYWVEMAGGGQVTEEVFANHLAGLKEQLEPGRTAQFNAMYMDPYLWNLQFGNQHIVSKARDSGAPLDGVVVSAGIPELEQAQEIIADLSSRGFKYLAFKPGTVGQIKQVLDIARSVPETPIIIMIEDGHAGGHHSWEGLDQLLLATYADIRATENTILVVGGGLGVPERATSFLTGTWSQAHGRVAMPVDGIMIGTAAMTAKEAKTSPDVKRLLVETPGISPDDNGGWVAQGAVNGGVTSGLSHLLADMYEVENSAAKAARLIVEVVNDAEARVERHDEIIAAINKTAKPYFGELDEMTYAEVLNRYLDLCLPWTDPSWEQRFFELLQRWEARLSSQEFGTIESLYADVDAISDPRAAVELFLQHYPSATDVTLTSFDVAWFIDLCRKYPKPIPFVPVIDDTLLRSWGTDCLWQSHDTRYSADQVRIIPGPVSVAGITEIDEPVSEILGRYETHAVEALSEQTPTHTFARNAQSALDYIRNAPFIHWHGHLITNPTTVVENYSLEETAAGYDVVVHLDTMWDGTDAAQHAVRELRIPLIIPAGAHTGAVPVVDDERLPQAMFGMLAATAGVGGHNILGDDITALPTMVPSADSQFGEAHFTFSVRPELGALHAGVTADGLPESLQQAPIVPAAVLGLCWPAIYAALGSTIVDDYPVIEGLLNAVHLDHTEQLDTDVLKGLTAVEAVSRCTSYSESASGRVVVVETELRHDGQAIGAFTERFAIRGRVFGKDLPADPPEAGGLAPEITPTPRSLLRKVTVTAPNDMTAFAMVSGDYNPIHTSYNAAKVAGMDAPLVHGMWLCGAAQHAVAAADEQGRYWHIASWTYRMFGPVELGDVVEISVERTGSVPGGALILETTCRVNKNVVSRATALVRAQRTAYVYPGQGIQTPGMALDERAISPASREVWERADRHTRKVLDFSIIAIVRDNPTVLEAHGVTYRHPAGVLNLTQFTQVALATVAFAQTERLRESGALVDGAYFAGHSLGEYNALAAYAKLFPLETVIEIVFHRGSTMHNLVPRDAQGNSDYQMGALRPNQLGLTDATVGDYIKELSERTGEFIEIVNYNLADEQYSIAGTRAGLAALAHDAGERAAAAGGKRPFILIPGIDVPFHSTRLRDGVPDFRGLLDRLLPEQCNPEILENRYIPNLVARPFALNTEFLDAILDVVPSEYVADLRARWNDVDVAAEGNTITRQLLVELLAWQFASPVRWIETQQYLFRTARIETFVEIGLASSPTLANLASRTLKKTPSLRVDVYNVQRDASAVYHEDQVTDVPVLHGPGSSPAATATAHAPAAAEVAPEASAPEAPTATETPAAPAAPAPSAAPAAPAAPAATGGPTPDLPFVAADGLTVLLAHANKLRLEQIVDSDNVESLTNGVSSKRNQVLMDMAAELNLPAIDGGAEAPLSALSATVNKMAHNYQAFGPVLTEAVADRLRKLFGAAGLTADHIGQRVRNTWGLTDGWVAWTTAILLLDTRDGKSPRGGELAVLDTAPTTAAAVDALIDSAVQRVGQLKDVPVALPQAGGEGGGNVVDSAALDAFADEITGTLADNARDLLARLGKLPEPTVAAPQDTELLDIVSAELGSNWPKLVRQSFNAKKALVLNDRWATAREDIARIANGELSEENSTLNFHGTGEEVATQAEFYADRATDDRVRSRLLMIANQARDTQPGEYSGKIAVVTGMTPDSIGGAVVKRLLAGGATVVATASRINQARLLAGRKIYRENARGDAALWLVPANLGSYRDIDALIDWIGNPVIETVGANTVEKKPAMIVDLLFPFAAPPVFGMMDNAGPDAENQARIMLWGVERLLTGLAQLGADTVVGHHLHAVLPGSPNRGLFGGDGAYGEVKAAFDALLNKWKVEPWAKRVTLAHARIGWVRGTGLMGGNDPLVKAAEAAGVHTWSTDEMADQLMSLASKKVREQALQAPIDADLTGGLDNLDFTKLDAQQPSEATDVEETTLHIPALPSPHTVSLPAYDAVWDSGSAKLEDTIVIVGVGEVGPWGSARTRAHAELGIQADGTVELTAAGVLELAWMTGLLTWHDAPQAGWYDADNNMVPEEEIYERFHDEVVARSGVRHVVDDNAITDGGTVDMATIYLDTPVSFLVPTEAEARAYEQADPTFTSVVAHNGQWQVTRKKGATALVPRKLTLSRFVTGQLPTDFDPERWGIPTSMIENVDKMAVWNLVTTVDAFLSAGFEPGELLQAIHPSEIASTQGTGFGGMSSMHKLFVERFISEEIPQDILQETLPNVIAAHTMQSYVGGYGSMVQPVAACASAAISLEEGVDKIATGKAQFVVTGAIDDLSIESLEGFGNMNATADSQSLADQGINERFFSRAGDLRRGGFIESQGGGTVLIARGDLAYQLGLPVYAVVGYVQSFADGVHSSIPAPGLGSLAAARGGKDSRLAKELAKLGVEPDDISVVSKHDTSTNANDPNEADIHVRLAKALGRSAGNPLHVISQKTLTGHSKGGAALFQISGLIDVFASGWLPANRALDNLDPVFYNKDFLVWLRDPFNLGQQGVIKAALATSLGFGHVSSLMALVHPGAFEAALERSLGAEAHQAWRRAALARLTKAAHDFEQGMIGHRALYQAIDGRRLRADKAYPAGVDAHDVEAAMLLDPEARLGADGYYEA